MLPDALFALVHGTHPDELGPALLHLLHPQHWAVPVLAVTSALLAMRAVRRAGAKAGPVRAEAPAREQ